MTWLSSGDAALAFADDLAVARELLAGFDDELGDRYRALIDSHPDACHRTCRPGHLTGPALSPTSPEPVRCPGPQVL